MALAKKSLGQNFLTSASVARNIVRAASLSKRDTVLEVGPGKGILTSELLREAGHVIAVEKDTRLIPVLKNRFAGEMGEKKFTLIEGDILEMSFETLGLPKNFVLVANIPYYITGVFLRTALSAVRKPSRATLMLQREVATRILAREGKESILSISVKVYGTPRIVYTVPAHFFSPKPNVDSAVLCIEHIKNSFKDKEGENHFFSILKSGFAHKRKLLIRNLETVAMPEKIKKAFAAFGIAETVRAEDMSVTQWHALAKALE